MAEPRQHRPGTVGSALSHRAFRWIFLGGLASNIGTWMQNFTLGALADDLTGRSWYIGLITFAQLGPTLLISPFGGVLADTFDRRRLMIGAATAQACFSLALARVALSDHPSTVALVGIVFAIGVASAVNAPVASATIPALVGRADLAGAISLNSAQMNVSRVVGPLMAGLLIGVDRPALIFGVNAATYLFVIAAVGLTRFDSRPSGAHTETPRQRFLGGLRAARDDVVIRKVLVTVSLFSFCSLIFIYQLAPFARLNLGGDSETFTAVFSAFALGASLGAIGVGTVLTRVSHARLVRWGLWGFAVALGVLAVQHRVGPAAVAAFVTGWCYFVVITSLSTILQQRVHDEVRGRVMGLWMMGWAGLVPLGSLVGGPIIDLVGLTWVFLFGAAVAVGLAVYSRPDPEPDREVSGSPSVDEVVGHVLEP